MHRRTHKQKERPDGFRTMRRRVYGRKRRLAQIAQGRCLLELRRYYMPLSPLFPRKQFIGDIFSFRPTVEVLSCE